MRRLRISVCAALLAAAALAQTASDRQGVDVFRVGARIACKCGSCSSTLASCNMLECGFGKPAKERIFKMQHEGMSDAAILDVFLKEYGQEIFRSEPNVYGRLVPYSMLVLGALFIVWLLRRYYRKPAPLAARAPESAEFSRYREQIERDLSKLE
jgi:cytochrome c-type biogenesis protein CcmH/NrfF